MAKTSALEELKAAFPADQIALPGSETYKDRNGSYVSQLESDISPSAIFLPKDKADISTCLKIFQKCGQKFAVRGAGQQPLPGAANIEDGITIDLTHILGIELTGDVVSIAAGERWSAVYNKLHDTGLSVTGGRSGNNGIGGLALAGGLSFFSSREGFICDNVVNYEVVLASGEIVNANARENPDLFKVLKGGGNNFGIVTRFDMRTFQQGPFWGGAVFYFPDQFPAQIEALSHEINKPDASDETHIMISLFFAAQFGQVMGLNQVYYTREVENPPEIQPFVSMQPQVEQLNSMKMTTVKSAADEQASMAMTGVRCAYMNTTVKPDTATLKAGSEIFSAALEKVKDFEGMVCSFTLQPYPESLLRRTEQGGGNVLGIGAADGPLMSILLLMYWKNVSDDEAILGTARGVIEAIDADAAARGTAVPYKYLNYAFGFQDPIASYGAENKKMMQDVSRKYDPEGLFQKNAVGGFKLFP
ncbi:FAD-binding domain-containing protein [Xylariomycetidae sp. FL2044]|nr:FAD-binding domain-containing protein [Xylariomycetidae sp. FL2044]